jgi:hypothetical protein
LTPRVILPTFTAFAASRDRGEEMGLLDIFRKKGSEQESTGSIARQVSKLTNKHVDSEVRTYAAQELAADGRPEAIRGMLKRFRFMIDSSINDQDEKQLVCELLLKLGSAAEAPLIEYIQQEDEVVWALRSLKQLVSAERMRQVLCELLAQFLHAEHIRFPQKEVVVIDHCAEFEDEDVARALLPFLEDDDDDVRLAAVRALGKPAYEELAREEFLRVLAGSEDRPRVVRGMTESLAELQWPVRGHRPAIEKLLPEGYYIVRKGTIRHRGEEPLRVE